MRSTMITLYAFGCVAMCMAAGSVLRAFAEGASDPGMGPLVTGMLSVFVSGPILAVAVLLFGIAGALHLRLAQEQRRARRVDT